MDIGRKDKIFEYEKKLVLIQSLQWINLEKMYFVIFFLFFIVYNKFFIFCFCIKFKVEIIYFYLDFNGQIYFFKI